MQTFSYTDQDVSINIHDEIEATYEFPLTPSQNVLDDLSLSPINVPTLSSPMNTSEDTDICSISYIEKQLQKPMSEAAKAFQISHTHFKYVCRSVGVICWPSSAFNNAPTRQLFSETLKKYHDNLNLNATPPVTPTEQTDLLEHKEFLSFPITPNPENLKVHYYTPSKDPHRLQYNTSPATPWFTPSAAAGFNARTITDNNGNSHKKRSIDCTWDSNATRVPTTTPTAKTSFKVQNTTDTCTTGSEVAMHVGDTKLLMNTKLYYDNNAPVMSATTPRQPLGQAVGSDRSLHHIYHIEHQIFGKPKVLLPPLTSYPKTKHHHKYTLMEPDASESSQTNIYPPKHNNSALKAFQFPLSYSTILAGFQAIANTPIFSTDAGGDQFNSNKSSPSPSPLIFASQNKLSDSKSIVISQSQPPGVNIPENANHQVDSSSMTAEVEATKGLLLLIGNTNRTESCSDDEAISPPINHSNT